MNIRHNDIKINRIEPFSNCKLDRKQYANILTDIIQNYSDGFVLGIDNKWGTGKTTFVKMWRQYLDNEDFQTLYFNAWENDFEPDILVTLISELSELKTSKNEESLKKVISKAAPLAKSLALGLLKTQIEKYVGNDFAKELISQTANTLTEGLHEQIKNYTDRKNSIAEFRESLQTFVSSTTDNKPVVFIIDELDRCRPNYAVELLEQVKHLFTVKGIVFVLSIDKVQLGNAVKGVYGSDLIDSDEYLRRFIDIEYSLPEPDAKLFCNYLYDYFQFDEFFSTGERHQYSELQNDKSSFIEFAYLIFDYGKLPLRVQEKIFAHARLSLKQFEANHYLFPSLFILLIYIKLKHKEIYISIKNLTLSLQSLTDKVESILPNNIKDDDLRTFLYTIARLIQTYNNAKEYHQREPIIIKGHDEIKDKLFIKSQVDWTKDNEDLLAIFQSFSKFYSRKNEIGIKHLIQKIELTEMIKKN